jgi:hypothetical protein
MAKAVAIEAIVARATAPIMNVETAKSLPPKKTIRRGWRTSKLRRVPCPYSIAICDAAMAKAMTPSIVSEPSSPFTEPVERASWESGVD